jgi:glycosidase
MTRACFVLSLAAMRTAFMSLCVVAACSSPGTAPSDAHSDAAISDSVGIDAPDTSVPPYSTVPRDKIFYHAYVRSFADSDGDGIGDFAGMQAKLDYIKSIGVDGILLLPIFDDQYVESGGYGTVDYTHVTAAYGGDAAFASFVAAAHARGLVVMLDLSFSLVADSHPWFVAAQTDHAARSHFIVTAGPPCPVVTGQAGTGWYPFPDTGCYFSDYAAQFPSLNVRDPATATALGDAAVQWLAAGVDGFRLDSSSSVAQIDPAQPTVKDLNAPASHAFWLHFMQRIKQAKPDAFTVAELWYYAADYFADGIDMAFEYNIYFGLVDGWQLSTKQTLSTNVAEQLAERPAGAFGGVFAGNHDFPGDVLPPGGRSPDMICPLPCSDHTPLVTAAMLVLSLPGTPFIYYGEELGLHGAQSVDSSQTAPWSRNPMQWNATAKRGFTTGTPWAPVSTDTANVAAQDGVDGSMLETYRGLIGVRKTSPALQHGDYTEAVTSRDDVFAFVRHDAGSGERVLVVASFAHAAVGATVNLAALGITAATAHERIFGGALPAVTAANAAAYPVPLAAQGAIWIALQ